MASTSSFLRPPRPAFTLQAFPFTGLVGAGLLAIASLTTAVAAVTGAVSGTDVEIVAPTGDLPPIAAAAYLVVEATRN